MIELTYITATLFFITGAIYYGKHYMCAHIYTCIGLLWMIKGILQMTGLIK